MEDEEFVDTGFDALEDLNEGIWIDRSNPHKPNIVVSAEENQRIGEIFSQTLVVKLVGKTTTLAAMKRNLPRLWGKRGKVKVSDVENDYYMVGFQDVDDYMNTLTGEPWTLFDSYLSVMRWRSDFEPLVEEITKIAVWVRLPGLSFKYFDKKILWNVRSAIGKVLRVDTNTAIRARGMYARICVEFDLKQPLIPQYTIDGVTKQIEYESMGLLCLCCGHFGHVKDHCKEGKRANQKDGYESQNTREDMEVEGPWKVVQRSRRGRRVQN
ncbi:uncharacterized protein LOC114733462 [Neltuma alba]|uniref:uncharacterized protein LOC114733462 n=1 Tax=Neltuma alba TaxID=207710 RepID=UPI0010A34AA5|nr:uncharacterized protein LOC114733462 [Prosopis alba]